MKLSLLLPLIFPTLSQAFAAPVRYGVTRKTQQWAATPSTNPRQEEAKFGWDKEPPKASLERRGKSHTASQSILNLVEVSHWSLFLPSFLSSWAIMEHMGAWIDLFQGDSFRACLWLLAPMLQSLAGLPAITAHAYEDWQVTPSADPSQKNYDPEEYCNERLRRVSTPLLMTGLGVAALSQAIGYHGLDPVTAVTSLAVFAYAVLGDQNNLASYFVSPFFNNPDDDDPISVLPVPVCSLVFFVYSQILLLALAILPLLSLAEGNLPLQAAILLPVGLSFLGGVLESGATEVRFDQRIHLVAVGSFFAGFSINAWGMLQLGQMLA